MVFYKNINDLSEKILKISRDEKLRRLIAKNGKKKYMKYFNSTIVADFIINKTLDINKKRNIFGMINEKIFNFRTDRVGDFYSLSNL